ncbi:magnesium/cobalt transporter CorA [Aquamicrobium sp. LC103]|uniref:magnesium/cobalt transporter CorA n=1 Tax=Aquamicrobium sp. LC103 TaxID=1120658 RepID=UPI001485AF61|nr:magnesium/cobalt transporter CorA [Aquamicrobium sp. LC103]
MHRRRAPVGAPPGTLIPDERASPTSMRLTLIGDDTVEEIEAPSIADVGKAVVSDKRLWLDVVGLGDLALLEELGRIFDINPLALEDVHNTGQRPKMDVYGDHALVFLHMTDGQDVGSKEQLAVLFDDRHVVTFQERAGDCLDPVRKRLRAPQGRMRRGGPAYLAYAIIDTVLDAYFPLLERIGDELEDLENLITTRPDPHNISQLHAIKRDLLVVKRATWPTREMLSSLTREDFDLVPDTVRLYLRDTYDHAVQLIDIVETYRELTSGLLDLYLSNVSTKMNEVMKVLTIVATIFIPLTFMAGVWGMNFDPASSPWNMPELSARYGYPLALLSMAATGVGLLLFFRWKKWL